VLRTESASAAARALHHRTGLEDRVASTANLAVKPNWLSTQLASPDSQEPEAKRSDQLNLGIGPILRLQQCARIVRRCFTS